MVPILRSRRSTAAAASRRRAKPARRTELGLLVFSCLIVVSAYVLASIGTSSKVPTNLVPFLVIVLALSGVAHIANRILVPDANPVLLPIASLLNGLGYVMLAVIDQPKTFPPHLQAAWTAVAVALYVVTLVVVKRSRDLDRYRYLLLLAAVFLLLSPLIPGLRDRIFIGTGESVSLFVKLGPISGQPVEIAKLLLVIFFASYFSEKRELLSIPSIRLGNRLVMDPRPLLPIVVAWGFAMLILAAERDVGFTLLLFLLFIAQLWLATGRARYIVFGLVLFAVGAYAASILFAHVDARMTQWLHPSATGQLMEGLYGMGSGGVVGTGLGFGQVGYMPLVGSDLIFAAIGTEWGLLGSSLVVFAFLLLVGAGLRIAQTARSEFAKLTAAGLTVIIGLQSFFIMAGVVRLLPLTGVTLPFVAYGGSSLVANYVLLAMLMRISDEGSRPAVSTQATATALEPARV